PLSLSIHETATRLNVTDNTVVELVNGKTGISPEMALRLELAFGKSAESWLAHQAAFDLWQLESRREQLGVSRVAA
ncbi:MAG: HigA family addiction module antitoxin, partial [Candidatus Methylumidiphilus sp.]